MNDLLSHLERLYLASDQYIRTGNPDDYIELDKALEALDRFSRAEIYRRRFRNIVVIAATMCGIILFVILNSPQNTQLPATLVTIEAFSSPTPYTPFMPICGGTVRVPGVDSETGTFRRDLGLTIYNIGNSRGGILDNNIRAVALDERGVWFGYFPPDNIPEINGIGQFNKQTWENCRSNNASIGLDTNDIAIADGGDVWVVTDGHGVSRLNGNMWTSYTAPEQLPDNRAYVVRTDDIGVVWVGTWEGVASFDGLQWSTTFTTLNSNTILNNHVHALTFHPNSEVWIGFIDAGISRLTADGLWLHYSVETTPEALQSNKIRGGVVDANGDIWFTVLEGGVSRFEYDSQTWINYTTANSALPNDNAKAIALDKFGRVWVSTESGVTYFDGTDWQLYSSISSLDIAFGPACVSCPYNDNHVWLGTSQGLTHSQIPPISQVVDIISVDYPREVISDEKFSPRIVVRVQEGYQLRPGDGLFFAELSNINLFRANPVIEVDEVVNAGETYEFIDTDTPFNAPSEPGIYTSTWRIWQQGRYVGEPIILEFEVLEPPSTP